MAFPDPVIDARGYQEILDEALARIPVHNPEWTNHNDSDPGVTLLQLFAFMAESMLYRANLVPARNRLKFLRLLGIPLRPAEAARGLVTVTNPRGPLKVELLPDDLELTAGSVPFRVRDALDVLPIEMAAYYKALPDQTAGERASTDALYRQLYGSHLDEGDEPIYYVTRRFETPENGAALPVLSLDRGEQTVDGALWLALLARTPAEVEPARRVIANRVLSLGMVPALSDADRVLEPSGRVEAAAQSTLIFEVPQVVDPGGAGGPRYRALEVRPKANLLMEPGVAEVVLPGEAELRTWQAAAMEPLEAGVGDFPPTIEDQEVGDRLITWLRIRPGDDPESVAGQVEARVSWVGINVARVTQRARVRSEFVGQGTGEPGQRFTLANTPVIAESVQLTVNGELWRRTDDLAAAPAEVPRRSPGAHPGTVQPGRDAAAARVYTVDRDSGVVTFGSGLRGARPPLGAVIQAGYDHGGGLRGMVGIGAISKGAALPAGLKVRNPVPTWGGDEAESIEAGEERIPLVLRHRERLVSAEDFEEITRRTPGVQLGRVDVLPLVHPDLPDQPADGVVTVLVAPRFDAAQPEAPRPDRLFLDTVCAHLDPRRLVTTEVHVRGPDYVPVHLSVGIEVAPGHDIPPVREAVQALLRAFLSPLHGGHDGLGWPLARDVDALELAAVAARADGVAKVAEVLLARADRAAAPRVPVTGLELPHLARLAVQAGPALPLDAVRGTAPSAGPRLVPIPIVPAEC